MLKKMVQDIIDKKMQEQYAHALIPAVMHAQVTKVSALGTYEYKDMKIGGCEKCKPYTATITGKWYEYNLKMLTKDGALDDRFPEVPGVKSKVQIKLGGGRDPLYLFSLPDCLYQITQRFWQPADPGR